MLLPRPDGGWTTPTPAVTAGTPAAMLAAAPASTGGRGVVRENAVVVHLVDGVAGVCCPAAAAATVTTSAEGGNGGSTGAPLTPRCSPRVRVRVSIGVRSLLLLLLGRWWWLGVVSATPPVSSFPARRWWRWLRGCYRGGAVGGAAGRGGRRRRDSCAFGHLAASFLAVLRSEFFLPPHVRHGRKEVSER